MSAPGLQDVPAVISEPLNPNLAIAARLSAVASANSANAALLAIAATGPAIAEPPAEIDAFLDVLSGLMTCPITGYQRELLTSALTEAIDSRIATLLSR